MGTNYYIKTDKCKHCGRSDGEIHLGKSSVGWKFIFNLNGSKHYRNVDEMKAWMIDKQIIDEYGTEVSHQEFWKLVEVKQKTDNLEHDYHAFSIGEYRFVDHEFS